MKKSFEDELISGMQDELRKNASAEMPKLSRAADCLHSALEILEQQGLHARADEVLQLLEKLAKGTKVVKTAKVHSLQQLMEAGVSQRDLMNFGRGDPRAVAKLNLVLRRLGMSDHDIVKFLGPGRGAGTQSLES
jgi:phosphotransferase system HPr-like phosphotransfer protein